MRTDPLARYRALQGHCQQMLEAARSEDWEGLQQLGRESGVLVARLHRTACTIDENARREKFRILRRIVEIDAEIRHISQPWTRTVDSLLDARSALRRGHGA